MMSSCSRVALSRSCSREGDNRAGGVLGPLVIRQSRAVGFVGPLGPRSAGAFP